MNVHPTIQRDIELEICKSIMTHGSMTHPKDGSSALQAIPPVHVKSLLEESNLKTREQEDKNNTFADQYAKACRDYLDGKLTGNDTWVTWKNIVDRIGRLT